MSDKNSFTYEIEHSCGVVSESSKGWTKELNLVSWSGRKPKYDLRDWSPDHEKLGKGVTLSADELRQLGKIINDELKRIDGAGAESNTVDTGHIDKPAAKTDPIKPSKKKTEDVSGAVDYDEL